MLQMKVMVVQDEQRCDQEAKRHGEEAKASERRHERFMEMISIMMAPNLKVEKKSLFDDCEEENLN